MQIAKSNMIKSFEIKVNKKSTKVKHVKKNNTIWRKCEIFKVKQSQTCQKNYIIVRI